MALSSDTDRRTKQVTILDHLLAEQGIDRYGLFLVTGEGKDMPDGGETASGYVVNGAGQVFFFWIDWDETKGGPTFSTWRSVQPDEDWLEDSEYREALEAAGVTRQ